MTTLPAGITGFNSDISQKQHAVAFDEFKTDMFELARRMNAQIQRCNPIMTCENYFSCEMTIDNQNISILCNTVYPILACTDAHIDNGVMGNFIQFDAFYCNIPKLRNYTAYDVAFLNTAIDSNIIANLSPTELSELNYHGSKVVHEIVFNYWD